MAMTMEEITKTYICYDGPMPPCPEVDNMTDEEIEREFQKRFGKYLEEQN